MTTVTNMIPLRERKKAETKKRIVAAAMKIFAKKGIEAATVDEIAAAASRAGKPCLHPCSSTGRSPETGLGVFGCVVQSQSFQHLNSKQFGYEIAWATATREPEEIAG